MPGTVFTMESLAATGIRRKLKGAKSWERAMVPGRPGRSCGGWKIPWPTCSPACVPGATGRRGSHWNHQPDVAGGTDRQREGLIASVSRHLLSIHAHPPTGQGTGLSLQLSAVQPEVPLRPQTSRPRGPVPSAQKPIHVAAASFGYPRAMAGAHVQAAGM